MSIVKVVLVAGTIGSGKTFLLKCLPKKTTKFVNWISPHLVDQIPIHSSFDLSKFDTVVISPLNPLSWREKRDLKQTVKKLLAMGKRVYVHCYPKEVASLSDLFLTQLPQDELQPCRLG